MKEKLFCKVEKTESGFKYDCGEERKGFCRSSVKSGGGGLSVLGSGGNVDVSKKDLDCFDIGDLRRKLTKKYSKSVIVNLED